MTASSHRVMSMTSATAGGYFSVDLVALISLAHHELRR